MTFQPSQYSNDDNDSYGWASAFPLSALTVTNAAPQSQNQPDTAAQEANLSLLSDFLAKIPFKFRINSGYRSYYVNTKVGGVSSSQHMNGLGLDITPIGMSNQDLAAWFYQYQADFPELDQVIVYTDTSHVHLGICPPGATGCSSSRWESGGNVKRHLSGHLKAPEFLKGAKKGRKYPWAPTAAEQARQAALFAANRPLHTGLALFGIYIAASAAVSLVVLAALWRYTRD
jgi:hypothetical protein